jgi:hypothetical protein
VTTPPSGQKVIPTKWRKSKSSKAPYQGWFVPGNKKKYVGKCDNPNDIAFRSGMELRLYKHLDASPTVVSWSSEETVIRYVSPLDNKVHRYFVDALATITQPDGSTKTFLIEVKPKKQCELPTIAAKPKRPNVAKARYLRECNTYAVNQAKWDAAKQVCKKMGWIWTVMTEDHLVY